MMSKRRQFFYYVYWLEWKKRHLVKRFGLRVKRREKIIDRTREVFRVAADALFIGFALLAGAYYTTIPDGKEFMATHVQDLPQMMMAIFGVWLITWMIASIFEYALEIGDWAHEWPRIKHDG